MNMGSNIWALFSDFPNITYEHNIYYSKLSTYLLDEFISQTKNTNSSVLGII